MGVFVPDHFPLFLRELLVVESVLLALGKSDEFISVLTISMWENSPFKNRFLRVLTSEGGTESNFSTSSVSVIL